MVSERAGIMPVLLTVPGVPGATVCPAHSAR